MKGLILRDRIWTNH